jgi:hypothetical protein
MLEKSKHEHFAQLIAGGETAGRAYSAAYGSTKAGAAAASAHRLLQNAKVSARIGELRQEIAKGLGEKGLRSRSFRLDLLQKRSDLLEQVRVERAEFAKSEADGGADGEWAALGGLTGLVCRDYRGKNADRAVYKVDNAMLAEMRAIEEQAAREKGERLPGESGGVGGATAVQVNVTFVSPA